MTRRQADSSPSTASLWGDQAGLPSPGWGKLCFGIRCEQSLQLPQTQRLLQWHPKRGICLRTVHLADTILDLPLGQAPIINIASVGDVSQALAGRKQQSIHHKTNHNGRIPACSCGTPGHRSADCYGYTPGIICSRWLPHFNTTNKSGLRGKINQERVPCSPGSWHGRLSPSWPDSAPPGRRRPGGPGGRPARRSGCGGPRLFSPRSQTPRLR